jgi:hypothetical protein
MTGWTRAVILSLSVWWLGCGGGKSSGTTPSKSVSREVPADQRASIAVTTDRFPHDKHTGDRPEIKNWQGHGLGCKDCHSAEDVRTGVPARAGGKPGDPSIRQHAPCDDCHHDEFAKPPGPLCKVCHVKVDPFTPMATTGSGAAAMAPTTEMRPYPSEDAFQALASTFSHEVHLDRGKMEAETGHHTGCVDTCHKGLETDAAGMDRPKVPTHAACIECHEGAPQVKAKLPMDRCEGCHLKKDVDFSKRGRIFITGDLIFHHKNHLDAKIDCKSCHKDVDRSSTRDDMAVPSMEACSQCHETDTRTVKARMENCHVCHSAVDNGSPPTNHMISGALPTDHTLEFRRHHAEQAANKDAPCRFCHQELQGRKEDSCFQCHQVMRPHDHNLMFRDDHGREAEADGQRCAQCHAPETCVACHSIPPASHTPIADFRQGGHAQLARFELTACLTCHTFETTCSQCHRGTR